MKRLILLCALLAMPGAARASIAYGTLNNFDCVNDTGVEAHGFEIELDDIHSKDITYTYDYNHYGIPKITEDNTDPLHPKVFIRYAGSRRPDGTWTAYTAIPAGPISPTDGHQFTNPSINFGGEHFGAGYYGAPTAVKYNWLIDDGTGNLVHGPPVMVSTPTFTYYPPVPAQPVPQVQAVIVPPPPPVPPVLQFGDASWVKDIKTTTHNANKVELVDLVDPDPADPLAKNWANGEPAEVETEWRILQTEFAAADGGKNGELKGAPEDLPNGNEVITRRYEFYKYIGPIDAETGEAMADQVDADGIHGVGEVTYADYFDPQSGEWVKVTVDLSTVEVVGEFFGAQMAGFDIAPALGLIDHLQDGEVNVDYPERTVVVGGGAAFLATLKSGSLPQGITLGELTGVLSGKPTEAGSFTFTVEATDTDNTQVSKEYTLKIVLPLAVTTANLPGGTEMAQYQTSLAAEGGAAPYVWTVDALPQGLTLSDDGVISGVPSLGSAGAYTLRFTVTDSQFQAAFQDLKLVVAPAPPLRGDINNDWVVDRKDLDLILAVRNKPATGPNDPRDLDRDGKITVLDARICVTLFTKP